MNVRLIRSRQFVHVQFAAVDPHPIIDDAWIGVVGFRAAVKSGPQLRAARCRHRVQKFAAANRVLVALARDGHRADVVFIGAVRALCTRAPKDEDQRQILAARSDAVVAPSSGKFARQRLIDVLACRGRGQRDGGGERNGSSDHRRALLFQASFESASRQQTNIPTHSQMASVVNLPFRRPEHLSPGGAAGDIAPRVVERGGAARRRAGAQAIPAAVVVVGLA